MPQWSNFYEAMLMFIFKLHRITQCFWQPGLSIWISFLNFHFRKCLSCICKCVLWNLLTASCFRYIVDCMLIYMSESSAELFLISVILPSHYEKLIGCICDILATKVKHLIMIRFVSDKYTLSKPIITIDIVRKILPFGVAEFVVTLVWGG